MLSRLALKKLLDHVAERPSTKVRRRHQGARVLADIDRCVAKAEAIAAGPEHEDHDAALDFLIEFQEERRNVKAKLRGN